MSIVSFILPFLVDPFSNAFGHAQIGLLQGFNSKFPTSIPTPVICRVPPPRGVTVVRVLWPWFESPRVDATSGLSLLQFFSLAPRGFSPGTSGFPSPQKPTLPTSNSIWNARTHFKVSYVGKKITKFTTEKMLYQFSRAWLYLAAFAIFRSYL